MEQWRRYGGESPNQPFVRQRTDSGDFSPSSLSQPSSSQYARGSSSSSLAHVLDSGKASELPSFRRKRAAQKDLPQTAALDHSGRLSSPEEHSDGQEYLPARLSGLSKSKGKQAAISTANISLPPKITLPAKVSLPAKLPLPSKSSIYLPSKDAKTVPGDDTTGPSALVSDALASCSKTRPTVDSVIDVANAAGASRVAHRPNAFGRGQRALSSGSQFASDNYETDEASGGPSTPSKKRKTQVQGIVLPEKSASSSSPSLAERYGETDKATIEMLRAASKKSGHAAGRGKSGDQKTVPTEVAALKVCPFCEQSMPRRPSPELCQMMQPWLDRYHAGKTMKATDTLEACRKHDAELNVIPNGKKQGWPVALDVEELSRRLERTNFEGKSFRQIVETFVDDPLSSHYLRQAVELRRQGRGKASIATIAAQMVHAQAGYYGEQGWETMRAALGEWFEHDIRADDVRQKIAPLSPSDFVEFALVPELACLLITDDYAGRKGSKRKLLSPAEAQELREASSPYGIAMFPADAGSGGDHLFADDEAKSQSQPTARQNKTRLPTARRIPSSSAPQSAAGDGESSRKPSRSRRKAATSNETPPSSQDTAYTVADSSPSRPCPKGKAPKSAARPRLAAALDSDADDSDDDFFVRRKKVTSGGGQAVAPGAKNKQRGAAGEAIAFDPVSAAQSVQIISSSSELDTPQSSQAAPGTAMPRFKPAGEEGGARAARTWTTPTGVSSTAAAPADKIDDSTGSSSEKVWQKGSSTEGKDAILRSAHDDAFAILSSQDSIGRNGSSQLSLGEPGSMADTSLTSVRSTPAPKGLAETSPTARKLALEEQGGLLADAWPLRPRPAASLSSSPNVRKDPSNVVEGGLGADARHVSYDPLLQGESQEDENREIAMFSSQRSSRPEYSPSDALRSADSASGTGHPLQSTALSSHFDSILNAPPSDWPSKRPQLPESMATRSEGRRGPSISSTSPVRAWPFKSLIDGMDVDGSPRELP